VKRTVALPIGSIAIEYDHDVYSPAHTSIDAIVLGDVALSTISNPTVCDVACGSGIMGLALKQLHPEAEVTLCDISPAAVKTAKKNSYTLELPALTVKCSLLEKVGSFDLIVTNLPTYDRSDMNKYPLFGPEETYFADETDGLKIYRELFKQLPDHLNEGGYVVIECQKKLHPELEALAVESNFEVLAKTTFAFVLQVVLVPSNTSDTILGGSTSDKD
jgi:HemK-like putative methylase